jgi:hypothetical protein
MLCTVELAPNQQQRRSTLAGAAYAKTSIEDSSQEKPKCSCQPVDIF